MAQLDRKTEPYFRDFVTSISEASDINSACIALEENLQELDCTLLSVKFCDSKDELPAIRCFGNYPCEIKELSEKLRENGGCPMTQEAIRLLQPFDAMNISEKRYSDFLSRRFLQEMKKTGHGHIAVIPLALNRGISLYSVGLGDKKFEGFIREQLVIVISQVTILLLTKFPELTELFVPKTLSSLQARCLMLYSNGATEKQISKVVDMNEITVNIILNSCVEKLAASNRSHAAAKAIRLGEFVNML